MGWVFAAAFEAKGQTLKVIAALFVLNSFGYFIGGVIKLALLNMPELTIVGITLAPHTQRTIALMQWGVCYGIGLGAGLGVAFHLCQGKARELLAK